MKWGDYIPPEVDNVDIWLLSFSTNELQFPVLRLSLVLSLKSTFGARNKSWNWGHYLMGTSILVSIHVARGFVLMWKHIVSQSNNQKFVFTLCHISSVPDISRGYCKLCHQLLGWNCSSYSLAAILVSRFWSFIVAWCIEEWKILSNISHRHCSSIANQPVVQAQCNFLNMSVCLHVLHKVDAC